MKELAWFGVAAVVYLGAIFVAVVVVVGINSACEALVRSFH
jgi:hypothetical protein